MLNIYRSDLVFGKLEKIVPEISWWKTDIKDFASFFRGAKSRIKELKAIALNINPEVSVPSDSESEEEDDDDEIITIVSLINFMLVLKCRFQCF